jgi:MFS family permease
MNGNRLLRALSHRNYRLFFAGQSVSLIGTWMQQVAMSWRVFELKHDPFYLGLVLFCGQIPALFLAPVAGVLTDRWNRHRMLLATQSLAMAQAFLLAFLDLAGLVAVWHLILLSLFLGVVNTFDMTARQTFLTEMVADRQDLGNAIALNSSTVNGARLLGPSLAGLVLAKTSAGVCFLLNGVSYVAVLIALLAMDVVPRARAHHRGTPLWRGLAEGFRYAFGFAPIRALLLMLALASMAGMSYNVLLPDLAVRVLHGGKLTYAFLYAASGVGALCGAVFLASRPSILGLGKWVVGTPALLGLSLMGLCGADRAWVAALLLVAVGFAMMVQMAASNTILQTIVEEDKRGRVMSFYTMAFLGTAPLGSLLTGYLARAFGPRNTFLISGLLCVFGAGVFAIQFPRLRALVRPIYARLQILPPLPSDAQATTELGITQRGVDR